jgi:hypothetical protein
LRELSAHSRLPDAEPGRGTRNAAFVHENAEAAQGEKINVGAIHISDSQYAGCKHTKADPRG